MLMKCRHAGPHGSRAPANVPPRPAGMTAVSRSRRASREEKARAVPTCVEGTDVASCRAVLRLLSLALTVAAACCPDLVSNEIFLIRNPDADTQALIDACRDPAHPDCVPLCEKVSGKDATLLVHCEMHPDSDGYAQVHVRYHEQLACY